jgi:hypothetical protein
MAPQFLVSAVPRLAHYGWPQTIGVWEHFQLRRIALASFSVLLLLLFFAGAAGLAAVRFLQVFP